MDEHTPTMPAAQRACSECGKQVATGDLDRGRCMECAIADAERKIPVSSVEADHGDGAKKRYKTALFGALVVVFLVVAFIQVPKITPYINPSTGAPARQGVQRTNAGIDSCIENLGIAADQLDVDGQVDPALACPVSGGVYVQRTEGGVTVIECPSPAEHDLTSLWFDTSSGAAHAEQSGVSK